MPIYRGATKVAPVRDVPLSRVYRGDRLVWSAAPAEVSGSYGPITVVPGEPMDSYVIQQSGDYTIIHSMTGQKYAAAAIETPGVSSYGENFIDPSVAELSVTLTEGDIVEFGALLAGVIPTVSGTWSITPA